VFCSNCFEKQGGGSSDRPMRFDNDRHERPRFEDRQMHDATCDKCGKACQVPFRPMGGKPIFCENCFEKPSASSRGADSSELLIQIKVINDKVDKIMKILDPKAVVEKTVAKIEKPEIKEAKKEVAVKEVVKEKKEKKVVVKKAPAKKKK
jgi:CxxC-x17-CxxC domain-containing protein